MTPKTKLILVRLLHTVVWALMVGCIVAVPVLALADAYVYAAAFAGVVLVETMILLYNGWRCPLTDVAARYTDDQHIGFDIFLPSWLARHNKLIFGSLFVAGVVVALLRFFTR